MLIHGETKHEIIQIHHVRPEAEVLCQKQRFVLKFHHG